VYGVQDWAEVHRLHHRDGVSQAAIASRLGMSRNTVARLLSLTEPPRYERRSVGSKLDPFKDAVVAMWREDPKVAATVICQQLRRDGFDEEITILKDWLRQVRPQFVAAAGFQRTSYRHGEICQVDWWHTGIDVPVGKGAVREAMGLVATLPSSAAHAVVFTLSKTVADFCAGLVGCLQRLGGVAEKLVVDNDTSIVVSREGWHPPVAYRGRRAAGTAADPPGRAASGDADVEGAGGAHDRLPRALVCAVAVLHRPG